MYKRGYLVKNVVKVGMEPSVMVCKDIRSF